MTNDEYADRRRILIPGCICPQCGKSGRSRGTRYFKTGGTVPLAHPYRRFFCRFCKVNWKDFESVANLTTSDYPTNRNN